MATIDLSLRIHVSSSVSVSGTVWTVFADGEEHAIFSGGGAKSRAIESALRLAEELRTGAPVLVVVEPEDGSDNVTRVVRSRLAS